jgi:hypothetical protein
MIGKMPRSKIPKEASRKASCPLNIIHSDLCGPFPESITQGEKYFISFIDEYTRYTIIYGLRRKYEAIHAIKKYIRMANTKFHSEWRKIQILQID